MNLYSIYIFQTKFITNMNILLKSFQILNSFENSTNKMNKVIKGNNTRAINKL